MNFLDYFFYWSYKLTDKVKEERDAKWSAFLFTSFYSSLFILLILNVIGLLYENPISKLFKNHSEIVWMGIFVLTPILIGIRYYRIKDLKTISVENSKLTTFQSITFKVFLYLFLFLCPILVFITVRKYLNW
jgi:cytochrome b561